MIGNENFTLSPFRENTWIFQLFILNIALVKCYTLL